jgi:hypothetical protein
MDLKGRIERLESLVGVDAQIPPLIVISTLDCRKDSQDAGDPTFAVIPGKIGGPPGFTLNRAEDETENDFLKRGEAKHQEFYKP